MRMMRLQSSFSIIILQKGKNRGIGLAKIKDLQKKYKFDILVEMQEIHNKNWISFSVIK